MEQRGDAHRVPFCSAKSPGRGDRRHAEDTHQRRGAGNGDVPMNKHVCVCELPSFAPFCEERTLANTSWDGMSRRTASTKWSACNECTSFPSALVSWNFSSFKHFCAPRIFALPCHYGTLYLTPSDTASLNTVETLACTAHAHRAPYEGSADLQATP